MGLLVRENVPLAPFTTLGLGGRARYFVEAAHEDTVAEALTWATQRGLPAVALGGGSNVIVPDAGVDGLVLRLATRGMTFSGEVCEVQAGEPWDQVVEAALARGLAGIECLSGIPGSTGATPIQNVGAYGQEVAETITAVRVLDRHSSMVETLTPAACSFAYRDSAFKRDPARWVVLAVTFRLRPDGTPTLRYPEVQRALTGDLTLARVREVVLGLRRKKSMVIDAADPNSRSVGSFFTNPIVDASTAAAVVDAAGTDDVPRWPTSDGRVKLSAGWLIERAGINKGLRRGAVGVSANHALALVHHGGGSTTELLALARHVRAVVQERFGVTLVPEPVILGGHAGDPLAYG